MFENIDIIITSSNQKKELLKTFNDSLKNIKIYNISEFNRLFYYDYDIKTILYVMEKYNVINDIANIYLKNLTYIKNIDYKSTKLNFLKELKNDLLKKELLKSNKLFIENLKNKNILILNLGPNKEIELLKQDLSNICNVEQINNKEIQKKDNIINELTTIEDEVVFVANDICRLIKDGIDIRNIYLTNLSSEYYKLIKRIFPMFNIPYTINDSESIYGTYLSNKFLELYKEDMSSTMSELKKFVDSDDTETIYNQILDIVNKYAFIDNYNDVKSLIKTDLKATKIKKENILYSVHESNIDQTYTEEDYVYLLSFNQGIIPIIHRDELYLNDKDREELNISLTVDKNNEEIKNTLESITQIPNLTISFKRQANGEEYNISNLNNELNYSIKENTETINNNSNIFNQIKLTSLKDEYNKYGTTSDDLYLLSSTYPKLPYDTYKHTFTSLNKEKLHKYLDNKLSLSYTKVDNYYKCPFSYYLNYVLKLNIYEETFYQKIGTLFHAILEKFNTSKKTYDELWQEEINNLETTFNNKELFFLEKLHDELLFVIETLKEQETYTELHEELHEEKIYTSISGDMKISFSGIIDKVKYKKENNRTIIAIIDYKTGSVDTTLKTIPYGIGMQLPVYLYLASNSNKLENIEVAGFYLQHILNNEVVIEKGKTYDELKKKALLLQGFSNDNIEIISTFDSSYAKSNMIKSLSLNKDNSFSSRSKVLSSEQMTILKDLAEKNIIKAAKLISDGEFDIAPKKIGDINYGCRFCKFNDICFKTNDDIVEFKELQDDEVFGGDF